MINDMVILWVIPFEMGQMTKTFGHIQTSITQKVLGIFK